MHLTTDGHLGRILVLAAVDCAAVNMEVWGLFACPFHLLLVHNQLVAFLDHVVALPLIF